MSAKTGERFDRDKMAREHARRHIDTDAGVAKVYHLPGNAPPREVRLLEVNTNVVGSTLLEPIDFGVDAGNPNGHTLVVLDVTPEQWDAIREGRLQLPAGWSLDGSQEMPARRKPR